MNKETAPYVQAILETAMDPWLKSLRQIERRLRESGLASVVDDPALAMQDKKDRLQPVLQDTNMGVTNLVYSMAGNGQLHLLDGLLADLEQNLERIGQGLSGTVRSAVPLTGGEKERLAAKLTAQFGPELVLSYQVDPTVIGGIVVRVGDLVIDGSVAARLAALREKIV